MRDIDRLIAAARQQGWRVERRRSGHFMLTPPSRAAPLICVSGTPSDSSITTRYREYETTASVICGPIDSLIRMVATAQSVLHA